MKNCLLFLLLSGWGNELNISPMPVYSFLNVQDDIFQCMNNQACACDKQIREMSRCFDMLHKNASDLLVAEVRDKCGFRHDPQSPVKFADIRKFVCLAEGSLKRSRFDVVWSTLLDYKEECAHDDKRSEESEKLVETQNCIAPYTMRCIRRIPCTY